MAIQAKKVSELAEGDQGKRFRVKPFPNEEIVKVGQYLSVDNSDFHWFAASGNRQFSSKTGEATEVGYQESVVAGMEDIELEKSHTKDSGVWYEHQYKAKHPDEWKKDYEGGYAPEVFTRRAPMDWQLKQGVSASEGLRAWLEGLTIAECATVLVAVQLNGLLQTVGDRRFDELFGSKNAQVKPKIQLLVINGDHLKSLPKEFLKAPEKPEIGQKFYFQNVNSYLYRHPDGAFSGENAIYVGDNKFKGFGLPASTWEQMQKYLYKAYVEERSEEDYKAIMLSEANKIDTKGMLELKEKNNYSFKSLFHAWKAKDVIHPAFVAAEEAISSAEFQKEMKENGVHVGPTLDLDAIKKVS